MLTRRGNTLIMWTVTFLAVVSAIAIIQPSIKRILADKIEVFGNYTFWGKWYKDPFSDDPTEYVRDKNSRAKTKSTQIYNNSQVEQKDPELRFHKLINSATLQRSVSSGVGDGNDPLLDTFDLNQFNLKN